LSSSRKNDEYIKAQIAKPIVREKRERERKRGREKEKGR
jgi:hypothetical protein